MFLFEGESPKGKNREGGPGQNFRQEIYAGRIRGNFLIFVLGSNTSKN